MKRLATKFRAWFQRWFESRLPLTDTLLLTQRNVYILPTAAGWMMVATLLTLLVASINYQLNLGYMLTFLIGGSVLVGIYMGHNNLRGLQLSIATNFIANNGVFSAGSANFDVILSNTKRHPRYGIGLSVVGLAHWTWTDVPAQGSSTVQVTGLPLARGLHRLPSLTAETRFPLGTFRVWTVWRPALKIWVYPAIETAVPPLPAGEPRAGEATVLAKQATGEYDGVRTYRRGDPLKLVVWKKAAKNWADVNDSDAAQTASLLSRDMQHTQAQELWLDFARTGYTDVEKSLSRLCAWVLQADKASLVYGLRLPQLEIAPASGEAHKTQCLQALAAY